MLPKMETPVYELTLPSSGKKIKYRPFIVKERKILLLALEDGKPETIFNALGEMFKLCTFGECDIENMPIIDSEFLFINIRNKSIGEDLDIFHTCTCGDDNEVRINMDNIEVEGENASKDINLGNDLWITMNYPSLKNASILSQDPTDDEIYTVIASCINNIIKSDAVFKAEESSITELKTFVEEMTQIQIDKLEDFFSALPRIVVKGSYKCKCGKDNDVRIEGLENFFG